MTKTRWIILYSVLALLLAVFGGALWVKQTRPAWWVNFTRPKPLEQTKAFKLFKQDVYPLLTKEHGGNCVECHDQEAKSGLKFFGNVTNDFKLLLHGGYFATQGADSVLERITTTNEKKLMPKGKTAQRWNTNEVAKYKNFLKELNKFVQIEGVSDELFPPALVTGYAGPVPDGLDNTFISYRQLKGKIQTIFNDDWVREGRDRFQENLALFGGADFKERFNESSKASSSFLSALEMMSREVAARAYSQKVGPFAGREDSLPSPEKLSKPDSAYEKQITQLYEGVLFRKPTDREVKEAFTLIQNIFASRKDIEASDVEVSFKLTVEDAATKQTATRIVTIPVSGEYRGLYQELLDQSRAPTEKDTKLVRQKLAGKFTFKPGDVGQCVKISNLATLGNVVLHSIELQKIGGGTTRKIAVTDASVQAEGAWKIKGSGTDTVFDDDNTEKGGSSLFIPVGVSEAGQYEITVVWPRGTDNANGVLVEVLSGDTSGSLAKPPLAKVPPRGEAHFFYDSSADNVEFADLKTSFQFGKLDFIEINNKGTRRSVTASAVRFLNGTNANFLVDGKDAAGRDKWANFDSGKFKAYNQQGKTPLTDENKNKGDLFLRFSPAKKDAFKTDKFYQLQISYPAKAGNETRVPVIVKAQKSSPIIQLAHPARARGDAAVELDASASYTVQGSKLKYTWQQVGGPWVKLDDKSAAVLKFKAPRRSVQQTAWESLTRALIRHPDFLFTRPPAITFTKGAEKQRLQLVKIALDLAGRAPTKGEFDNLAKGATLAKLVDDYLATPEFKDFYFHRIRLYLESQGTDTQDEPARLWCYVAFNDRPFQEILTANYSVDKKFAQQTRPAFYGKTGVLTTKGFIEGKPGLPHYNYAAQVSMLFLGYVFEVPPEIIEMREGITASGTTDPASLCYSCHKLLTPLALQRQHWDDDGKFRTHDEYGLAIDASDNQLVDGYPFAGEGLEAFATQAVRKERFTRTLINTHFTFYFGREMRWRDDERFLYKRVWDALVADNYKVRTLIKTLLTSPEYLEGKAQLKSGERTEPSSEPKLPQADSVTKTRTAAK